MYVMDPSASYPSLVYWCYCHLDSHAVCTYRFLNKIISKYQFLRFFFFFLDFRCTKESKKKQKMQKKENGLTPSRNYRGLKTLKYI